MKVKHNKEYFCHYHDTFFMTIEEAKQHQDKGCSISEGVVID